MKKCSDCKAYPWCINLCKEASDYVSQDEINQKELTIGIPLFRSPVYDHCADPPSLTPRQKKVGKLLARKLTPQVASQLLGISTQTFYNVSSQIKCKNYSL